MKLQTMCIGLALVLARMILAVPGYSGPSDAEKKPFETVLGGGGKKYPDLRTNKKAIEAWQDARFGIYLTWGVSALRGVEVGWSRGREIPKEEYDQLWKEFNPVRFNAKEWVDLFKAAGARYAVYQTKHHDGFCMWDTAYTDYNIMNGPYGKDPAKMLAKECKKQGIIFGTYYSVCDWWHEEYLPRHAAGPGRKLDREPDFDKYVEYMKNQLKEHVQKYDTDIFLFDGHWDKTWTSDRGMDLYKDLRDLKDEVVISPRVDRGHVPQGAGDYNGYENRILAFSPIPWEAWNTIAWQWNWSPNQQRKSVEDLLRMLVVCAGRNGNLHLSIGPMADGRIDPREAARLKGMGDWLKKYGEAIYETRGGPFNIGHHGNIGHTAFNNLAGMVPVTSTRKGNTVYLHILRWRDDIIELPNIDCKLVKCSVLTGGDANVSQDSDGIKVSVAKEQRDEVDTIVKLQFDKSVMDIQPIFTNIKTFMTGCTATASGEWPGLPAKYAFDGIPGTRWGGASNSKDGWLAADLGAEKTFNRVWISEAYDRVRKFELQVKTEDAWRTIHTGTTLGRDYSADFEPVTAQHVRLNILEATDVPTIWEFQLFAPKE
jgi:alpha-L-fucosidase